MGTHAHFTVINQHEIYNNKKMKTTKAHTLCIIIKILRPVFQILIISVEFQKNEKKYVISEQN